MGIRLTDLMQGAAQAGAAGYMEGFKADILAERDAALAKVRGVERAEERTFRKEESALDRGARAAESTAEAEARVTAKTEERKFKSGESKLDRESREKAAKLRGGGATGKWIRAGDKLVNNVTGEKMDMPESVSEMRKTAAVLAKIDAEGDVNRDLDKPFSAKQLTDQYVKDWSAKQKKPKDEDTSAVVFRHSTKGDITEDDIKETMAAMNLTRQQVLDRLGK